MHNLNYKLPKKTNKHHLQLHLLRYGWSKEFRQTADARP